MADDDRPGGLDLTARLSAEELGELRRARGGGGAQISLHFQHRDGVRTVALGPGESLVVGRALPSNLVIPDDSLSRQHARLELIGGEVWVEDLGSTNGTRVDGELVERYRVTPGAEATLGAVSLSVQRLGAGEVAAGGLESHERFGRALSAEVARARACGRRAALLLVRGEPGRAGHLSRWLSRVQRHLRGFDLAALYCDDTVEALLPEADVEAARALAERAAAEVEALAIGLAVFPDHGASADELVEAARDALGRAGRGAEARGRVGIALPARAFGSCGESATGEDGPVVRSSALARVFETARAFADAALPVLIRGETGTGKEVVARTIHEAGPRRGRPLIAVNCGAIPATLVESTLFGHEKGAFTGADRQAKGVFEAADGGTVFLDEIGELPLPAQAALLRVLETRRFARVGSTREIEADVRVIAATHRDLERMSAANEFRRDLFYRLDAMALTIPPLRKRPDDIEPLVARFVRAANASSGRSIAGLDADAADLVKRYSWPGNVRELRNAIDRAVVIARGLRITAEDLPERVRELASVEPLEAPQAAPRGGGAAPVGPRVDLRAEVARFEADLIRGALDAAGWDRNRAADALGLPLRTLANKIQGYGLKKPG